MSFVSWILWAAESVPRAANNILPGPQKIQVGLGR
jgi:hypothetical protein